MHKDNVIHQIDLEALKKRAVSVQEAIIKNAIKVLRSEDMAAGRQMPRDVLTYIRYVNERFLAAWAEEMRQHRYALKGGNAITVLRANKARFPSRFDSPRETRDIDMRVERRLGEDELLALFRRITDQPEFRLLTGLSFGEPKIAMLEARDGYLPGAKVECTVFLGPPLVDRGKGTPFKLEMSFGDLLPGSWAVSAFPTLADLAPGRKAWAEQGAFDIAHVVPEMMFADKLHAVARYGLANTRLKDIFDLHCLAAQYDLAPGLVKDCLRHVFKEFNEEHLLVGAAAELAGLDSARFATAQNQATWRTDWRNWTGVPFGKEAAGGSGVPSIELGAALASVAAAVDAMGLFGPDTAALAEEARLRRKPVVQLAADLREALAAVRGDRTRAAHAALIADLLRARAAALLDGHGAAMEGTGEAAWVRQLADVAAAVEDALVRPDRPIDAAVALAASYVAVLPPRVGPEFPLRALLGGRLAAHARALDDVGRAFRRGADILAGIGEVMALERGAAAALGALRLPERQGQLAETQELLRTATAFCDNEDRRRLETVRAALGAAVKALGHADHKLARAAHVREDIANNAVGKGAAPEAHAERVRQGLVKDAAWVAGELARVRSAAAPFLPKQDEAPGRIPDPDMDAVLAGQTAPGGLR